MPDGPSAFQSSFLIPDGASIRVYLTSGVSGGVHGGIGWVGAFERLRITITAATQTKGGKIGELSSITPAAKLWFKLQVDRQLRPHPDARGCADLDNTCAPHVAPA
jgi:hypothetical protein